MIVLKLHECNNGEKFRVYFVEKFEAYAPQKKFKIKKFELESINQFDNPQVLTKLNENLILFKLNENENDSCICLKNILCNKSISFG